MTDNFALWELVDAKFRSGNSIPVERIVITRAEYEAILERPVVVGDGACDHDRAISSMSGLYYCTKCFISMGSPTDYPECSGDPASCPENEGHGCCMNVHENSCTASDYVSKKVATEMAGLYSVFGVKPAHRIKVTDEMVDRYVSAVNAYLGSLTSKDWEIERFDPTASIARVARIGLTAAIESMVRGKS